METWTDMAKTIKRLSGSAIMKDAKPKPDGKAAMYPDGDGLYLRVQGLGDAITRS
jgi:hypothetical protein